MIPDNVAEAMSEMTVPDLRHLASRAEELADEKDREHAPRKRSAAEIKFNVDALELPRKDAPERATLVYKTIDERHYFYWNWRDEGTVKSEYIKPVKRKK